MDPKRESIVVADAQERANYERERRGIAPGMLVIKGWPPEPTRTAIFAAFPSARSLPVIYAWGMTVFASNGAIVGPEKMAHEAIHCARQGFDVEAWWLRYIADPAFRLAEEIPAHIAEYLILCEMESGRAARRRNLSQVAAALASPLYGRLIGLDRAKQVILDGASATKSQGA